MGTDISRGLGLLCLAGGGVLGLAALGGLVLGGSAGASGADTSSDMVSIAAEIGAKTRDGAAADDYNYTGAGADNRRPGDKYDDAYDVYTGAGNAISPGISPDAGGGGWQCQGYADFGEVRLPEAKGIALDDTTLENCADEIPTRWPNTNQNILTVRLFKVWGMTPPMIMSGDRKKAWRGLKSFAVASGAKFLIGVSVTCNKKLDEREWEAGMEFINYVGVDHIMGLAVGNEIDLQVGAATGACIRDLWRNDGYLRILKQRVLAFDNLAALRGSPKLPITAVLSNNAIGGSPFTAKVTRFIKGAWQEYGTRFAFSMNVYPQFSGGLRQAGCDGAARVGTSFETAPPSGFTPAVVKTIREKLNEIGARDMKVWLGETGWATHAYCVLGCELACRSKSTQKRYYEQFLKWDLSAGGDAKADHVFYFTLRDSTVFGKREEFGIVSQCGSRSCKF